MAAVDNKWAPVVKLADVLGVVKRTGPNVVDVYASVTGDARQGGVDDVLGQLSALGVRVFLGVHQTDSGVRFEQIA